MSVAIHESVLTGLFKNIKLARIASWHITITTNASSMYHHDCTAKEPRCQSVPASIVTIGMRSLSKQLIECCMSVDKERDFYKSGLAHAL